MAHSFEATAYLEANPDVAKAVSEGRMSSAWRHFVSFGFGEGRAGVPDDVRRKVAAVMGSSAATPPPRLMSRVHGSTDEAGFERAGKTVALDIYSAADPHLHLDSPLRVLDFGCGCARVLAHMGEIAPLSTLYGSDIDGEAIAWCRERYGGEVRRGRHHYVVNRDLPPTGFPPGFFDLIYVISVFTHLPEGLQLRWLSELRRIAKPGGVLVISVQGDALIRKHLTPDMAGQLDRSGFHYFPYGSTQGLPEYYQAAWHSRAYVDRVWSRYFDIIGHVPAGIADHQDLVLCMRPRPAII